MFAAAPTHPLDPLSKQEIETATDVLKSAGKISSDSRFQTIVLREPPKRDVLRFQPGDPLRREAFVVAFEPALHKTVEMIVDLSGKQVVSARDIPGVEPMITGEEAFLAGAIVHADPRWQEAIRKRGITDLDNVQVDPWPAGNFGVPEEQGIRMVKGMSYYRKNSRNHFSRPIEGLIAYVDLIDKKVFKLVDTGVLPVPPVSGDIDPASVGKQRTAPEPLDIVQPKGPSFRIDGQEVRWQKWRFRYAIHQRDGLVLYTVGYEDEGKLRSVLYRASLSEMIVPYGDPGPSWYFRNVFDMGEYGFLGFPDSLEPRTDAPANATFLNAIIPDFKGTPTEIPRSVALYERDGGLLWKHQDYVSGANESRHARELVLAYIVTAGNYEYGLNWVFHQDGTIEMEVLLTGLMSVKGVSGHGDMRHGHLVAPNVEAVHHQHFFNFRLDFDIDGTANSLVEMNTESMPAGPSNPYGGAFTMHEKLFHREQDVQRQLSLAASRKWKVINPSVKNSLGEPVGYVLAPGENSIPYAIPDSAVRRRAGFLNAHLWATPYDPLQTNAAGYYVNLSKGGDGLPKWIRANRPIENADIVLWYTMGITHIPRPEDWPVMPVHKAGFKLIPTGFFSRNPALDVPKPE